MAEAYSYLASGTIPEGALVSPYSTTADTVVINPAASSPTGRAKALAAAGETVVCDTLVVGKSYLMIAAGAITENAEVYTAANGKVQKKTTATLALVGRAKGTSSTDGDLIWVTYNPIAALSVAT